MQLEEMIYHCNDCTAWYTKQSIPHSELKEVPKRFDKGTEVRESHTCSCGGKIHDAHETGTVTPYAELRIEILREQVEAYEDLIIHLESKIKNLGGGA